MRGTTWLLLAFVMVLAIVVTTRALTHRVRRDQLQAMTTPTRQRIDLNAADAAALSLLPGVGPALAQRIAAYRRSHGPFHTLADLQAVKGVGPRIVAKLKPWVTVGGNRVSHAGP